MCGRYIANADYSERTQECVSVELPIAVADSEHITRATNENVIADVNLYLVGKDNGLLQHFYSTSSTLHLECPAGDYTIYAIANMHEDMGELSAQQIGALTISHRESLSDLPMTACEQVSICPSEGSVVVLPTIEVRRRVAKIAYRITVDPAVSDIRLQSVQAFNLPCRTSLFGEVLPSVAESDYTADRDSVVIGVLFLGRVLSACQPARQCRGHRLSTRQECSTCTRIRLLPAHSSPARTESAGLSHLPGREQHG